MINNKGFFIIFIGVVLLLNTTELISWSVWNTIFIFWPVLFIIAGFELLLQENRFSQVFISLITLVFLSIVFLYSLSSVHNGVYVWTKRYFPWIIQLVDLLPQKEKWYTF